MVASPEFAFRTGCLLFRLCCLFGFLITLQGLAWADHSSQSSTPAPAPAPAPPPTPVQIITSLGSGGSYVVTTNTDLGSSGALNLEGATLAVSSGVTVSTGTLNQQSGSLVVGGTISAAQSAYLNGSTTLTGTLQSPQTTLGSGGTLVGNGTVQGNLSSSGQVTPNGVLTVTGNYVQTAGSTLGVGLNTSGQNDKIVVGGAADVSGGQLALRAIKGFYSSGMRYTVVDAGGGNRVFGSVQQPFESLVLQFKQNKNGELVVTRNYQTVASSQRGSAAGVVLDQTNQNATTDLKKRCRFPRLFQQEFHQFGSVAAQRRIAKREHKNRPERRHHLQHSHQRPHGGRSQGNPSKFAACFAVVFFLFVFTILTVVFLVLIVFVAVFSVAAATATATATAAKAAACRS